MVQRLLLDGINTEAAGAPVSREDNLIVLSHSDEAETSLSLPKATEAGAEVALNPLVFQPVPVAGRNRIFSPLHSSDYTTANN